MKKISIILFVVVMTSVTTFAGEKNMLKNNGMFITNKLEQSDIISLNVFIKGGLFAESEADNGIGTLFSDVWLKSGDLMSKVEFYGGNIDAGVASDYFEFQISMLKDDFIKILPCLKKLFNDPDFSNEIFEREKGLLIKEIKSMKDSPSKVAVEKLGELTYGDFPYELSTTGQVDSVKNLSFKDIRKYYEKTFKGSNFIISLAGDFSDLIRSKTENVFEGLPEGKPVNINCKGSGISRSVYEEEAYPRIRQAKLYVAYDAPSAADKRYLSTKVLTEIMGGGMSSYYFNILRQQKGYAYAVGAFYPSRLCSSRYITFIGLDYDNVKKAVEDIKEINAQSVEMITGEDVENAKNYILGRILSESQSTQKTSWYAAFFANLGLGHNYFEQYIENLRNVSLKDVQNAAEGLFNRKNTTFVLKPENN
ncbi:M16 family metallopeptidase [Flexistipes sp.]|uniref:M16 family metallopeptidase n=1 Tax=Flexistipes sp. TaxID=3088135 RepID=UPI002E249F66|nr:pitrilysin family protein [Flexistipes sp.]